MRKAQEIPVPAEFITGRKEQASSRGSLADSGRGGWITSARDAQHTEGIKMLQKAQFE